MQKTTVIGNVSIIPQTHDTAKGKVCNFNVAENRKVNGVEVTTFYRVSVWNKTAEVCQNYLKLGQKVYLEGRLDFSTWTAKDGTTNVTRELSANSVEFLSSSKSSGEAKSAPAGAIDDTAGFTQVDDSTLPW